MAKDLMGGIDTYQFAFENEKEYVWRGQDSDGKVSFCVFTVWDKFSDDKVVCIEGSDNQRFFNSRLKPFLI